jgi:hypothetical protein
LYTSESGKAAVTTTSKKKRQSMQDKINLAIANKVNTPKVPPKKKVVAKSSSAQKGKNTKVDSTLKSIAPAVKKKKIESIETRVIEYILVMTVDCYYYHYYYYYYYYHHHLKDD